MTTSGSPSLINYFTPSFTTINTTTNVKLHFDIQNNIPLKQYRLDNRMPTMYIPSAIADCHLCENNKRQIYLNYVA